MKLSKQFMQTNIKRSYLYWQHISLNNLQQGTDGLSSGNSYKENSRSKSIKSTFFPPILWRLQTCSCLFLWLGCYFMYSWILPLHFVEQIHQKHIPQLCTAYRSTALWTELSAIHWRALSKVAGKEAKQHADVIQGIDKFKANVLTTCICLHPFAHPLVSNSEASRSRCLAEPSITHHLALSWVL